MTQGFTHGWRRTKDRTVSIRSHYWTRAGLGPAVTLCGGHTALAGLLEKPNQFTTVCGRCKKALAEAVTAPLKPKTGEP